MSVVEYRAWIDYYAVEPFGDFRADLRSGVVASTVARMLGGKGSRPKPLDFMPIVKRNLERQRAASGNPGAELHAAILSGFKGRVKRVVIRKGARHGA